MRQHSADRRTDELSVREHYERSDLGSVILDGLRSAGLDPDALTAADLAPVDQFHTRGRDATVELAQLAGITGSEQVLDVGGGLGGAARTLASEYGCSVTVLDLSPIFCDVGAMLTERTGLSDRVSFRQGSALAMPFQDASFDLVWLQHVSMNIADKRRLFEEIHRVLRPGGRLALHEIMAGPNQPISFPVPWAADSSISFVESPSAIRVMLSEAGFVEKVWRDTSDIATGWFQQRLAAARAGSGPPPLGLHLVLGREFPARFSNTLRNLEEQRIVVIEGVVERE